MVVAAFISTGRKALVAFLTTPAAKQVIAKHGLENV